MDLNEKETVEDGGRKKVTVIVPTSCPHDYLRTCLSSLSYQTMSFNDFEVLIILNGVRCPYEKYVIGLIQSFTNNNIKMIYTDIKGVSNARNIGIDNAKGEYIAFIDDDDFVSPNYLENLYKHSGIDVVPVCRPLSFIDGTTDYRSYNVTKDFDKFVNLGRAPFYRPKRFFNGPVYKLIHHSIIGNRRFDNRFSNGEDSLFMFLISDRIKYVEFADSSTVYYRRIRDNSATQGKKPPLYNFKNYTRLIAVHTLIFIKGFPRYNLYFYLNSILGRIKSIIFDR